MRFPKEKALGLLFLTPLEQADFLSPFAEITGGLDAFCRSEARSLSSRVLNYIETALRAGEETEPWMSAEWIKMRDALECSYTPEVLPAIGPVLLKVDSRLSVTYAMEAIEGTLHRGINFSLEDTRVLMRQLETVRKEWGGPSGETVRKRAGELQALLDGNARQ